MTPSYTHPRNICQAWTTKKKKRLHAKVIEMPTPTDASDSLLSVLVLVSTKVFSGISPSRSGYEDAENRQNGADSPIFSLLKAIYNKKKFQSLIHEMHAQKDSEDES